MKIGQKATNIAILRFSHSNRKVGSRLFTFGDVLSTLREEIFAFSQFLLKLEASNSFETISNNHYKAQEKHFKTLRPTIVQP